MQARARRTREKIIGQAKRAFAERGFEATNLTEHILTPAGVSVGSFYHQFSNKREVLLEIFDRAINDRHQWLEERIRPLAGSSLGDAYRELLTALFDDVDANPDVWRIQWREYESPDDEIRDRSMVGVGSWTPLVREIVEPWHPAAHPAKSDVARMLVLIAMSVVREYSHLAAAERTRLRVTLLDPAVTFAVAGTERMLD